MTDSVLRKHHLMIDRRWIDWNHGSGAPEGAFRFRVCPPTKRDEPVMVADKPLPGYGFEDAVPIVGDQPAARVTWKQPPPLGPWVGKPVRLRFRLSRATLFSVTC